MEPADDHPTIQHCIRSFEPYLAANRRTEKPVIHISLNPHPDDVLTDEQLTAIGQEYMEKMGYGNQPYIIYRHEDIGRPHIHIVSLRIDEQGKKIKDYKEWQRSTAVCRELERKYHLLPAEKMERRESLPLTAVDYRKGDIKHQIANVVKPVMQGYKFQSVKEFKALLGLFHVTVEEAHKTIKGKTYHGLVYAATDEKLLIRTGVLNVKEEEVRLYRILDLTLKRTLFQRLWGLGTIHVCSADKSTPEFEILNIKNPEIVKNMLSDMVEEERRKKRVSGREFMSSEEDEIY